MLEIPFGGSIVVEAEFYKRTPHVSTALADPGSGGKVSILSPAGSALVTNAAMTKDATGKYSYKYVPPNTLGIYTVKILADDTTYDGKIVDLMFRVIAG